jgi:chromosome segregation ATPase
MMEDNYIADYDNLSQQRAEVESRIRELRKELEELKRKRIILVVGTKSEHNPKSHNADQEINWNELPVRVRHGLLRMRKKDGSSIKTYSDISELSPSDIESLRGVGKDTMALLEGHLKSVGVNWR